jgi:hypothetical protein
VVNRILEAENEEPATVVDSIVAATAPPPASVEEKQSELERKIVRECIREYSKGGMYFAYNFGKSTDSTTLLATWMLRFSQTLRALCNINKTSWLKHRSNTRFWLILTRFLPQSQPDLRQTARLL